MIQSLRKRQAFGLLTMLFWVKLERSGQALGLLNTSLSPAVVVAVLALVALLETAEAAAVVPAVPSLQPQNLIPVLTRSPLVGAEVQQLTAATAAFFLKQPSAAAPGAAAALTGRTAALAVVVAAALAAAAQELPGKASTVKRCQPAVHPAAKAVEAVVTQALAA
jgi:hypothetical protein